MSNMFVTISKAASIVGEKVYIIKKWEEEFSEFVSIKRDERNARLVTAENIEMLRKIKKLKDNNMDTDTINQILQNQQRPNILKSTINEESVTDIKESLAKITAFIESTDVQELLKFDARLNQLESNVVQTITKKVADTAKLQTEVARIEFSDVQEMIGTLSSTSEIERAMYKEEIREERELVQKQTDDREERFLAFIKQHQDRQERMKQGQKSGLSFIKQFIGIAAK